MPRIGQIVKKPPPVPWFLNRFTITLLAKLLARKGWLGGIFIMGSQDDSGMEVEWAGEMGEMNRDINNEHNNPNCDGLGLM